MEKFELITCENSADGAVFPWVRGGAPPGALHHTRRAVPGLSIFLSLSPPPSRSFSLSLSPSLPSSLSLARLTPLSFGRQHECSWCLHSARPLHFFQVVLPGLTPRSCGTTLETAEGQFDGFFSQLPYKCHQHRVVWEIDLRFAHGLSPGWKRPKLASERARWSTAGQAAVFGVHPVPLERAEDGPDGAPGDLHQEYHIGPPWRQPRGKSMVSLVNSHANGTRIGCHLWEIDLRFALGLGPKRLDDTRCTTSQGGARCSAARRLLLLLLYYSHAWS